MTGRLVSRMIAATYSASLRLLPATYRQEFGGAMAETFSLRLAGADGRRAERARLLLRELGGVFLLALRERGGAESSSRPGSRPRGSGHGPGRSFSGWGRELYHATRRLLRAPAFTAAAVLTLAVAAGGNAAIFSVFHSILIAPLPYPEADRLVAVRAGAPSSGADDIEMTIGLYLHYRDRVEALDAIALYDRIYRNLTADGEPARLETIHATDELFSVLGVEPALGRTLGAADTSPDVAPVVVLSDALWRTRYGADPSVVGRTIILDDRAHTVVGVMPRGFDFPRPGTDAWTAWRIDRESLPMMSFSYNAVARLAPGASATDATAEIGRALEGFPEAFGWERSDWDRLGLIGFARPLKEQFVGDIGSTLQLFAGAGLLVVLLACANVTNLFLVRSEARGAEARIRRALGASRGQLLRYWIAEGVCVAMSAAALGLMLASSALGFIVRLAPDLPRLEEIRVSGATVAMTVLVAGLAAIVLGAAPLLSTASPGGSGLSTRRGATAGKSARRGRELLMGTQVALALSLTISAALMLQSVNNLMAADPGFEPDGVLTFRLSLPDDDYPDREAAARFHADLVARLSSLPLVESAGLARCVPLQGWCGGNPAASPDSPLPTDAFREVVSVKPVSSGYLETVGIRLLAGRTFEPGDAPRRTGAAVVNDALAGRLFPGTEPGEVLGRRIYPQGDLDVERWFTIVGVVGSVQRGRVDEPPAEVLYVPLLGVSGDRHLAPVHDVTVALRVAGDPIVALQPAREVLRTLDANLPIAAVQTLAEIHASATARDRFSAILLSLAAGAGLLLGAIGIYGVVSWGTRQRTTELGVRAALGARAGDLLRMVMARGLGVIAAGIAAGLLGSLLLNRMLATTLYLIGARDPVTFAGVAALLVGVGVIATWLPARRAARIDPIDALRAR